MIFFVSLFECKLWIYILFLLPVCRSFVDISELTTELFKKVLKPHTTKQVLILRVWNRHGCSQNSLFYWKRTKSRLLKNPWMVRFFRPVGQRDSNAPLLNNSRPGRSSATNSPSSPTSDRDDWSWDESKSRYAVTERKWNSDAIGNPPNT